MTGQFDSCQGGEGAYDSYRFALRLSPTLCERVSAGQTDSFTTGKSDPKNSQFNSIYLHETIHWWQHIGSSLGFMMSLSYPAQTHSNVTDLRQVLNTFGPQKSVAVLSDEHATEVGIESQPITRVTSNFHQLNLFRAMLTTPKLLPQVMQHPYYESELHAYGLGYKHNIKTLSPLFDPEHKLLPNPEGWEDEFRRVDRRNIPDVPILLGAPSRIGRGEIFEGQARFAQLQYLYFDSSESLTWQDAQNKGMLSARYMTAFDLFLELTKIDRPSTLGHPSIALFLLVCDIAINPTAGFPSPIIHYDRFGLDVHPDSRFRAVCEIIASQPAKFASAITQFSKTEYVDVAESLTRPVAYMPPLELSRTVSSWQDESEAVRVLMKHYETFGYLGGEHTVLEVLFSHFIAFNAEKLRRPEFFCWPGSWLTDPKVSQESLDLFKKHTALFTSAGPNGIISPLNARGLNQDKVRATFEAFFQYNIAYDMTRQWIDRSGPFSYKYGSFSPERTQEETKHVADVAFEHLHGILPDDFQV